MCNGIGYRAGSLSFGNDFAKNVVIFGVDNHKNNFFSITWRTDADDITASFGTAEKKFSINFSKSITKFCLSLHYNGDNSYLFF